jgi:hypothetical protein
VRPRRPAQAPPSPHALTLRLSQGRAVDLTQFKRVLKPDLPWHKRVLKRERVPAARHVPRPAHEASRCSTRSYQVEHSKMDKMAQARFSESSQRGIYRLTGGNEAKPTPPALPINVHSSRPTLFVEPACGPSCSKSSGFRLRALRTSFSRRRKSSHRSSREEGASFLG